MAGWAVSAIGSVGSITRFITLVDRTYEKKHSHTVAPVVQVVTSKYCDVGT